MITTQPIHCDYLFAGAGASATLLLLRMEKAGLLAGKKVVLVDADFTSLKRKTFSFWAKPDETLLADCGSLIQKSWDYLRINRETPKNLHPLQYHCIPGVTMHEALNALVERNDIERLETPVLSVVSVGESVEVSTDRGMFIAGYVYDSRPAGYLPPKPNETALFQSFIGYVIEADQPLSNPEIMDMMDFNVEQQGATQFMYVLPMAENRALVELTRFGAQIITDTEAKTVLEQYIANYFGEARILETETGCIPMCSAPLRVHEMQGVTRLGGRAGAIKPGTGYAFKNMHRQAVEICQNLQEGQAAKPLVFSARFRFYDRLLLWILCNKPEWGKPIFQQLFKKNRTPRILRFLDEKTTLIQDVGILMSLPFRPFLAALRQDLKHNPPAVSKPAILTAIALILWLIYGLSPSWYLPLQWVLLSAGLLAVGIPHGAVDHLLESGKIHGKPRPVFILKYLGIMLLYLLLWKWFPVASLLIFLLYSAFHFGQADIQEWQIGRLPHIKSFFWGVLILGIILFSHVSEVAQILKGMNIHISMVPDNVVGYAALLPAFAWGLHEKKPAILWSLLMLTIGMHLPVISAFGLYFIGQHSMNGWMHLRQGMRAGNRLLFLKALPFTLGAVALLTGFFLLTEAQFIPWNKEQFISVFFIFLACLSMPHVWAMHRFYKQKM